VLICNKERGSAGAAFYPVNVQRSATLLRT
jgi:hypothetical protein